MYYIIFERGPDATKKLVVGPFYTVLITLDLLRVDDCKTLASFSGYTLNSDVQPYWWIEYIFPPGIEDHFQDITISITSPTNSPDGFIELDDSGDNPLRANYWTNPTYST
ncbi:MAG: hypothetical protein A2381_15285 [Bdellovibrionales bacterium RIFOXYB1_FULL_37_110]|nr:MAG: hypothetical protein A2381_15285 [Bdellovibrionales bacterium RIFOXYB1_FULL_37_110]